MNRTKGMLRIGQLLLHRGIVDQEKIDQVLQIQNEERTAGVQGGPRMFGQILIEDLGVDRHTVHQALSEIYGFKELDLDAKGISEAQVVSIRELLRQLPDQVCENIRKKNILPFPSQGGSKDSLRIIAADPTDPDIGCLAPLLGYRRYEVCYVRQETLEGLIEQVVPPKNEFLEILEEASQAAEIIPDEETGGVDEEALDAEINQSLLVNLVEGCFIEAVRRGVSDIHIVPKAGNRTEFLFREDGKIRLWHAQVGTKPEAILAVFKDRSLGVDRFERERAQDGSIQRRIDGSLLRFRVSILPIVGQEADRKFESIVIRVLDDRKVITDLDKLGLQGKAKVDFLKAIHSPQGIVILTGPTGSGKTYTLNAGLYQVISSEVNVLTVEDPVELMIEGARQIKINSAKLTFEQAVRAILRHDPDIVMVGEMRDLETAQTAIKLANTGHLTFSTLHTNDAPSAVSRLYKMGVEPFLIANAINIVVAQRLIRKLCEKCKRPIHDLDPSIPLRLGFSEEEIKETTFYENVGCEGCRNGYKGRIAIHEALLFTKEIRRLILRSGDMVDEEAIREQAVTSGMLTLRAAGRLRIKQGTTSFEEVAAITSED
ncbi:MAG: ATPase, T2SS/T4P/T4SS family [Candidatus Latescibacterota bacterium]